ncbi:MAG TPA: HTTM domain-containing protein [Polyangiaceae bacterium]|nr:HTTM domain-containing protein [Polyangiaceae bacterium]
MALRIAYGLILSVSMWRFLHYGWVDRFFVEPGFHFKYWGLGWVGVLPGPLLRALFWALIGLGLMVACGAWFRVSAALLLLGFSYVQVLDVATYLNHYYLAALLGLLLALSPAGKMGTLAALWRRLRGTAPLPAASIRAAWLHLLRFQVGVVYVYAGLAKLHADWLIDGQPLGIWLASRADFPLLGPLFRAGAAPIVFSWAGFLFDTTIVGWLAWRRTRPYAYAVLVAFHALTSVLFPIGMFPVIMTVAALVFFPPDWPRRLLFWRPRSSVQPVLQQPAPRPRARLLLALGLGYCALQALLPLRFALYGGNVRWHEQGMRFSWRVMVREKNGSVHFRVTSERTGRLYEISPARYLTPLQEREMSGQPDLIAQLARHIRDDFARRGLGPVQVHADAWASLNGRRARRLIDPDVDLASVDDGIAPARWILPAPAEPPPARRG